MFILVTDRHNNTNPSVSFEELFELLEELQKKQDCGDNIFQFCLEVLSVSHTNAKWWWYDFKFGEKNSAEKVTELAKGKRLSIYVASYDSRHGELANRDGLFVIKYVTSNGLDRRW